MNPLIARYRTSQSRAKTLPVYSAIYATTAALMGVFAIPKEAEHPAVPLSDWVPGVATALYAQLWTIQLLLFVWATFQTARVIPREIEQKSYDFFRLLPLSPDEKALGIALGVNRPLLIFLSVNLVVLTLTSLASDISFATHLQLQLVTTLGGTLMASIGFLVSTLSRLRLKQAGALRMIGLAIFGFWILLPLLAISFAIARDPQTLLVLSKNVPFFGKNIPAFVLIASLLVYCIGWAYAGTRRQLRIEGAPLFPRDHGGIFLAGVQVITMGFVWPTGTSEGSFWNEYAAAFLVSDVSFLAVLLSSRLSIADYLEERRRSNAPLADLWPQISNLTTAALFLLVLSVSWTVLGLRLKVDVGDALALGAITAVTLVFLSLLAEAHTLASERFPHVGLITGFVFLLYLAVPAIAAAVVDPRFLAASGIDLLVVLVSAPDKLTTGMIITSLLVHCGYCVALGAFVATSYGRLESLAKSID